VNEYHARRLLYGWKVRTKVTYNACYSI